MFEIGVVEQFEAAHRLHGDFGPATRTHGHTYRLEVIVTGERLADDGTLFDITLLHEAVRDVVARLHYRDLDEIEGLRGRNTTAEVMSSFIFEQISQHVRGLGLGLMTVRVWESPQAFAAFTADLD